MTYIKKTLFLIIITILTLLTGELHANSNDPIKSLQEQFNQLSQEGKYEAALSIAESILSIKEKTFSLDHLEIAESLNNIAIIHYQTGNYYQALPLFQRALTIREQALGPNHPEVGLNLNYIGMIHGEWGNYNKAIPMLQKALKLQEQAYSSLDPRVAIVAGNLGLIKRRQGNYIAALPLLQRSLSIRGKSLGTAHPEFAIALHNLALLFADQGNLADAFSLFQQSLKIYETAKGPHHPQIKIFLENIAQIHQEQQNYQQAEILYQKAIAFYPPNDPKIGVILNKIALIKQQQGKYQESLALIDQSLKLNPPSIAHNYHTKGRIYLAQDNLDKALSNLKQALSITEKKLGKNSPLYTEILQDIAIIYLRQSQITQAINTQTELVKLQETIINQISFIGSEHQKTAYINSLKPTLDSTISLHQQSAPQNIKAAKLAFNIIIQRKGRNLDILMNHQKNTRNKLNSSQQSIFDNLIEVRSQLTTLFFRNQDQNRFKLLQQQDQRLADILSKQSTFFLNRIKPITLDQIQKQLSPDEILIEIILYQPISSNQPHYALYILESQNDPKWIDLGSAQAINQNIINFNQALTNNNTSLDQIKVIAHQLYKQIIQPIKPLLGNKTNLLISPDSELNRIPFAALVDTDKKFLIESYNFTYLTSARDLSRPPTNPPSSNPPLLIGNPSFSTIPPSDFAPLIPKTTINRSQNIISIQFNPLPQTETEIKAIAKLLPESQILLQEKATENIIKQSSSPRILHLAVPRFFLKTGSEQENPLLKSGLALTGFNLRQSRGEDGILTAQEIAQLELTNTQLVILSGAEPISNQLNETEAIYRLHSAFIISGAKKLIVNLWKTSDKTTEQQMIRYYQILKTEPKNPSIALKKTQLEMMQINQHPHYWANFILIGK